MKHVYKIDTQIHEKEIALSNFSAIPIKAERVLRDVLAAIQFDPEFVHGDVLISISIGPVPKGRKKKG